ncbi:exonuclease SbcCD subunit D C-terminal domain-containing protein [Myxococcus sp. MISCRS1]|uniref:exonuclease SbcCD subunit D C-terminal domain-containing protein n=1 Tax=unclassified Myxococcus TaxID=2648731 RepID=UPI001CBD2EAA|nr:MULTISPECIES: exonuclease SbcCD subunit D C-terminal domain-containing protein [unclassified Myxococcus]MBZ4397851.1 exonuclease SbcCD subunit D C-terminal domain-containing protein [Myxococcus sp. AS-1-15]MCY0998588.1 exonuclease SbcCD subunit D C-terminal domain-containing protein [Myxococcus sp. MISCRS1]BDT31421.1 exonuclease SbcCD subunit D C-terminal domain-containing protein [Myxococcus sp. MH1]
MRLLHTSDWHLGHTLYDVSREAEHGAFLEWLLDTLEAQAVDALLVAGDIFDTANPSAEAQAAWYQFIAKARRRLPRLDVVVIGGNHDSAARLDAPDPLFAALGVKVVGGLPRAGGVLDLERLLVPVHDAKGHVGAWVAAVPYLRPSDLPPVREEVGDRLVAGVRAVYEEVLEAARLRRRPGQALVAMGHCYMTGSELSELSERKILGGNQHALPVELFPEDVAYAALGHLHKAQRVGGREGVRYSGSPLPLSLSEANYRHQVLVVELKDGVLEGVESVPVPRRAEMVRVPARDAATLEEVVGLLEALPAMEEGVPDWRRPYLEVCVSLPRPEPALRLKVEKALEGRAARLVKLTPAYTGTGGALAEARPGLSLRERTPEDVFRARYARDYEEPPTEGLLEAFHTLLTQVQEDAS